MNYYEENKKLFPLQEGDVLVCEENYVSTWAKSKEYVADAFGRIESDSGGIWFTHGSDVPSNALFRRKTKAPANLVKGPPPEGVEADIYHVVTGPKVKVKEMHYHIDDPDITYKGHISVKRDIYTNGTETTTYNPNGSIKSREYEWEDQ